MIQNHCPVYIAATACMELWVNELAVFQALLGSGVGMERTEQIVVGARGCVYRVTPDQKWASNFYH